MSLSPLKIRYPVTYEEIIKFNVGANGPYWVQLLYPSENGMLGIIWEGKTDVYVTRIPKQKSKSYKHFIGNVWIKEMVGRKPSVYWTEYYGQTDLNEKGQLVHEDFHMEIFHLGEWEK